MLKEFFIKRMIESQMKDVPKEFKDKAMKAFMKNPDFFKEIAEEVQENTKKGKSQMEAVQEALLKRQEDVKKIFGQQ